MNGKSLLISFTATIQSAASCQFTSLFLALSHQLLSQRPETFRRVWTLFPSILNNSGPTFTETIAWSLLRTILLSIQEPIFCVIKHFDWFGQSPEYEEVLVRITRLRKATGPIRVLVTSERPLRSEIVSRIKNKHEEAFEEIDRAGPLDSDPPSKQGAQYFPLLLENQQAMFSVITAAVKDRIENLSKENLVWKELDLDIERAICRQGTTYLLAMLQIDFVRAYLLHATVATKSSLKRGLEQLPSSLDEFYTKMLQYLPEEGRRWARHAVSWIAFSFRLLEAHELSVALAFEGQGITDLQSLLENIPEDFVRDLTRNIGPFFKVVDSRLYPIHRTIRDFSQLIQKANDFHAQALFACLGYLSIAIENKIMVWKRDPKARKPTHKPGSEFLSYSSLH